MNSNRSRIKHTTRSCVALVSSALCLLSVWCMALPDGWSMGTPPFDADLRSSLSPTTKQILTEQGCLPTEATLEVTSRYRKLKSRAPIANKRITASLSFPGKDRKGSRLITVSYTQSTNADGEVTFVLPLSQALSDIKSALEKDRFYRGVRRVRGRVNLSLSSEDTFTQSIRYVPARGINFRICRETRSNVPG